MGKIGKEKLLKDCKCLTGSYNFTYCMNQCKKYRGGENFQECITRVIKYFPEEPEIDFDALWNEFNKVCTLNCSKCQFIKHNNVVVCYNEFLKSKNLTAPQIDMDQLRNEVYSEIVKNREQQTKCAVCGETKNTPLRRDDMGGYVCLSCIDAELTKRNTAPQSFEIPVKRTWTLKKEYVEFSNDFKAVTDKSFESSCDPVEKLKKYYDCHEEPDYSKIPVGSVVKLDDGLFQPVGYVVRNSASVITVSLHNGYDPSYSLGVNHSEIKSLEILKMPDDVK